MRVMVATDAHLYKLPDGSHWTPAIYGYSFWKRYLNVFDTVRIVARTKSVDSLPGNAILVDGPGIEVYPIPFFQGPKQLITKYFSIHKRLANATRDCDVAIFRVPSQTAFMTYSHIGKRIPVGGEVVYDPTDDLLRKDVPLMIHFLDTITSNKLKRFCRRANGVAYVTKNSIQEHYPSRARINGPNDHFFETYYSTITLNEDAFGTPRQYKKTHSFVLGFSNVSMNSDRKGEPILLRAVQLCRKNGYDVRCILVGDGSKKKEFENLAKEMNISEYAEFTGRFASSDEVRKKIMNTDLFVFPSQAEGLPRGILEAMAIGLPVLSTPVGGIPEIIDKKYLFDPNDSDGFARMIMYLADNPNELSKMSSQNYFKACEFRNSLLQKKRDEFYKKLASLKKEVDLWNAR